MPNPDDQTTDEFNRAFQAALLALANEAHESEAMWKGGSELKPIGRALKDKNALMPLFQIFGNTLVRHEMVGQLNAVFAEHPSAREAAPLFRDVIRNVINRVQSMQ